MFHELWAFRTRSDETHVPAQHVEDLWQLIDAQLADDCAHARDAWIPALRPLRAIEFRVLAHAAELQHVEGTATQPHAFLAVEGRRAPAILDLDGGPGEQHER